LKTLSVQELWRNLTTRFTGPAQRHWTKDEQLVSAGSGATASSAASHAWSCHLLNHSLLAKAQIQ